MILVFFALSQCGRKHIFILKMPKYPDVSIEGVNPLGCIFSFECIRIYWPTWACSAVLADTRYLRQV